jgi:hypothetical protein
MKDIKKQHVATFYITLGIYTVAFALIIGVFTGSIRPRNGYISKTFLSTLYNPRWNVYTRTPFEPIYKLYRFHNNEWKQIDLRPFQPQYAFGLRRDYKIIAQEMRLILADSAIKTQHYLTTTQFWPQILQKPPAFASMAHPNTQYLHGKLLIAICAPKSTHKTLHADSIQYYAININER